MDSKRPLAELIQEHAPTSKSGDDSWYRRYQKTHSVLVNDPTSDEALRLLWAEGSNGVASIRQGVFSGDEFKRVKEQLRQLTQDIVASGDADGFNHAYKVIKEWKIEGLINRHYRAIVNRAFAGLFPEKVTSAVNPGAFNVVAKYLNKTYSLGLRLDGSWYDANVALKKALLPHIPTELDPFQLNVAIWKIYESLQQPKSKASPGPSESLDKQDTIDIGGLNRILYGPPGTGKTYQTMELAVRAADPSYQWKEGDRESLRKRYDELAEQGRIRFVTFHQTFSYEDFVEGLTARTSDGSIEYEIRRGIFREIVESAKAHQVTSEQAAEDIFTTCWTAFLNELDDRVEGLAVPTKRGHFTVTEVDDKTIRFDKQNGESIHSLSVHTLEQLFNGTRTLKGGLQPYYDGLTEYLRALGERMHKQRVVRQNYVLIIDEINRGNISKIFGELITLLEPSKRSSKVRQTNDSIEVTLPLSRDAFSVPDNLYIIGTMNTADRSLAGFDLALRRRFEFVEMTPDSEALSDIVIDDIKLDEMLERINQRIAVLLDSDHCIGHAYFMSLKRKADEDSAELQELSSIFINKVLPLLQEYFFEDWERIRWVLNDQSKSDKSNCFIVEDESIALRELFPNVEQVTTARRWRINPEAFDNAESYRAIYEPTRA